MKSELLNRQTAQSANKRRALLYSALLISSLSFLSVSADQATIAISGNQPDSLDLHVTTDSDAIATELLTSSDLSQWELVDTIANGNTTKEIHMARSVQPTFFRAVTTRKAGTLGNLWCIGDS